MNDRKSPLIAKRQALLISSIVAALVLGFFARPVFAWQSKYYDFGPYYNTPQVLGFTFSSLENLPPPPLPDNLTTSEAGLTPASPFYVFERAFENAQLTFIFDPLRKEEQRLEFAEERLAEAKALIDQGKVELASSTLSDYSKSFKDIAQNMSDLAEMNDQSAKSLAAKVEEVASKEIVLAQSLALNSQPAQAEDWNLAVASAKMALDVASETLGEPAIPERLNQSLQELKQGGLISEEQSSKIYDLGSRGEVREELEKLASSGQFPASELIKLDTFVDKSYPEFYKGMESNLQVAELRFYQTLPQPSDKTLEEIKKWQENPGVPPSNDIRPYLWQTRAEDLAKEVNLFNFPPAQQTEIARLYPQAIISNSTYVAPPTPSPSLSPTPAASQSTQPTDQTATSSSAAVSPTPQPTPVTPQAAPYLREEESALPGQSAYYVKRFGENIRFVFTFDSVEKAKLKMQEAERRLAEADKLSKEPKKGVAYDVLYEGVIRDYQKAMSDASSLLKSSQNEKQVGDLAKKLESQAARHEAVWEKGLLPAPKDTGLIAEAIKATEDALDRTADIQGKPSLPPSLSNRLDDLKAQGMLLPEEAADIVNSASREEARTKIRKLVDQGVFPLADSKKMDEAQIFNTPSDYNQLVEVRKVEELQKLRSVQSEFAQTPTLKANIVSLSQREAVLTTSFDPSFIKSEDLGGRQDLVETYDKLNSTPRPINLGQFGPESTPGAQIAPAPTPRPSDAVLSTCPEGATFKQLEGCVWADSGRKINDYEQYKCEGPRQYYSFAVRKCVVYEPGEGFKEDAQPICPLGYQWSWQVQSCQASTGGVIPLPTPNSEPEPIDDTEREARSKQCPEGSSYKSGEGCVWDKDGKSVHDEKQYRCGRGGQYYSFQQQECVASPKEGEPYPKDASPICKESGTYWSWTEGKCVQPIAPYTGQTKEIVIPQPSFATPGSLFYPLKEFGENIRLAVALSSEAKQEVRADQARERLAEGYAALKEGDKEAFAKSLAAYTAKMQDIYNDLSKSSLSDNTKKAIGENLAKEAVAQNLILQKIEVVAKNDDSTALSTASSAIILGVDRAADLSGESPIPDQVKAKVEALPDQMISAEDKKNLLGVNSRVEARLKLGDLVAKGGLIQTDVAFLNEDFGQVEKSVQWEIEDLKKLEEIAQIKEQKEEIEETVKKNEAVVEKLAEFQKTYEPGKEVPSDIRPYVRLTRIEEVAQTIRPDIVRLEDFYNRKDLVLAVATLQEEFRPTKEAIQKVEEFRRKNPNAFLPLELARIEALSFSLGVRGQAQTCYLPTPPFPANTPCPPPGAPISVSSYATSGSAYSGGQGSWYSGGSSTVVAGYSWQTSTDKDGKPLVYGQGPTPESTGVCPDSYHWMYDSGGWCMSNSGNYNSSPSTSYVPSGPTIPGYTPYSPYYTAPGAYSTAAGYSVGGYNAPSYYGVAPTYYTTTPPSGTVPGSGPKPTAPGQCPAGYHWMSDSGGWCMADGNTYVPSGSYPYTSYTSSYPSGAATSSTPPPGGYNCGSQPYDPVTKKCGDGACPGGFNWDGSKCVAGGTYYSNSSYPSCPPGQYYSNGTCVYSSTGSAYCPSGYTWNGYSCQPSSGTGSSCTYPSGGCPGYGAWFDYSTCTCKTTTSSSGSYSSGGSYYGGSGSSTTNSCQGISCGSGYWLDYSNCSCKPSSYSTSGGSSCSPPSGGCGSGWFDSSSCSCKQASSQGCYNVSASSCGSGWYFDSAACTCRQSTSSSGSSNTTSSSGSCPSGYHWMSDNGGWCMSDGSSSSTTSSGGSTSTTTSSTTTSPEPAPPAPSTTTTTTSEPAPAPSTSTTTESSSPPPAESAPTTP